VSDRGAAVEAYKTAIAGSAGTAGAADAAARAVAEVLADDVVVQTNFGKAVGVQEVIALLREPRTAGLLAAGADWSAPSAEGDRVVVTARLPGSAPFGGIEFVFEFAGDKIARVEQQTLPAAPAAPGELRLTSAIKAAVNGALDNSTPMMIAYRDEAGEIHLSFRGTIQSHGDDQLALWARDPEGGLPRNIADRPQVTLFYHDPASRTTYTFYGRARAERDPAARTAIFENSHPREQQADFRRRGVAIVVDVDRVEGRDSGGRFLMLRALE
jgi:Pyridoxamine 5'-phosphate oxidase